MFGRRSQEPSAPSRVLSAQESAPMAVVKSTDARPTPIEARVPPKQEPVAPSFPVLSGRFFSHIAAA